MNTKELLHLAADNLGSACFERDDWAREFIGTVSLALDATKQVNRPGTPWSLQEGEERYYSDWYTGSAPKTATETDYAP